MRDASRMPKKSSDSKIREVVAENVRYARAMRRWSQEQLAELAGLHRTGIGALERAEAAATVDSVAALAKAIGVPAHVLLMPLRDAQPLILQTLESGPKRSR
ncbi:MULTISPECIES: helix-turn-helix domain-containing protein [Solimonas]|uniref:helix-turn-helix domain-containing protein n=1 Tax=Solimonas TaxID=413435 RepID=UPI001B7FEED0|nr:MULTISPECIES: helix-turn-helix transcriptional regulator [Solimonas]